MAFGLPHAVKHKTKGHSCCLQRHPLSKKSKNDHYHSSDSDSSKYLHEKVLIILKPKQDLFQCWALSYQWEPRGSTNKSGILYPILRRNTTVRDLPITLKERFLNTLFPFGTCECLLCSANHIAVMHWSDEEGCPARSTRNCNGQNKQLHKFQNFQQEYA